MKNASAKTISAVSAIVALAGLEHGVGEILQGNVRPEGLVIKSWNHPAFSIMAGEPAFTILPSFLLSGILTFILSLAFLAWGALCIEKKHGGLVLLGLSFLLFLVGGGFGPPLLGIILSTAGMRLQYSGKWWYRHAGDPLRRGIGGLWRWMLGGTLAAWLSIFPGLVLLEICVNLPGTEKILSLLIPTAFGTLLLALFTGSAKDSLVIEKLK
ncbi:MAG: hypothetical protein JXA25_05355 [Anaerolineales bacterium]|nr:hypothetical protein [Anaerolineales bacterium]